MEPLFSQLQKLPQRLAALSPGTRRVLIAGALLAVLGAVGALALSGARAAEAYQYAFTNLSPEDSAEASTALKAAGVPFRLEAGGAALAVPANRIYDARLLLATAGLPRGGGVGMELFDRGDLGVTEFTQKVNLRRALEGELARTISRFDGVRSARVHLTLPERGSFRAEERKATAAVVANLRPGRTLGERELAGIRHLVASSVPGLTAREVTIVDGQGTVLGESGASGEALGFQRALEKDLEGRVISLLEPVVGHGAVIVRVTAQVDTSETRRDAEVFDPEGAVLRSERTVNSSADRQGPQPLGVAGAAANQPLQPAAPPAVGGARDSNSAQDTTRNFEISKTTTSTVRQQPRLERLSVAILLDGVEGKPRADAEVQRLGELARRAVGFDAGRGDLLEISSTLFEQAPVEPLADGDAAPAPVAATPVWAYAAGGGALLIVLVLAALLLRRRRPQAPVLELRPGARVSELEAGLAAASPLEALRPAALPDPATALRVHASELASGDPTRALKLLRAWIEPVPAPEEAPHD